MDTWWGQTSETPINLLVKKYSQFTTDDLEDITCPQILENFIGFENYAVVCIENTIYKMMNDVCRHQVKKLKIGLEKIGQNYINDSYDKF